MSTDNTPAAAQETPAPYLVPGRIPPVRPAYGHGDPDNAGKWKTASGRFVPDKNISQYDKRKEAVLIPLIAEAAAIAERLQAFKQTAFEEWGKFDLESAEDYGLEILTGKGNGTAYSYDQQWKVQMCSSPIMQFDNRIKAAFELIDEILKEKEAKTEDGDIITALRGLLEKDAQGNLNPRRLLALRRFHFDDERWAVAMQAISDALQELGRTAYLRVYRREQKAPGRYEWVLVPLSLAKA